MPAKCLLCERPIPDIDAPFALQRGPEGFICTWCRGARLAIPGARLGRCVLDSRESSTFEAVRDAGGPCRITVVRSFGKIDEQALERDARQAAAVRQPGVLRLLGFGVNGEHVWVAEENPPQGMPLSRLLKKKLEPTWCAGTIAQLAEALARLALAHAATIEADAIVIDPVRGPFVSGFSASRYIEREGRGWAAPRPVVPGRGPEFAYMPPEQVDDATRVDARSIVYRAGALLYHMLAGERPFQGKSTLELFRKILDTPPPPIARDGVPRAIEAAVLKCLAKKREDRFATLAELATELRTAART